MCAAYRLVGPAATDSGAEGHHFPSRPWHWPPLHDPPISSGWRPDYTGMSAAERKHPRERGYGVAKLICRLFT